MSKLGQTVQLLDARYIAGDIFNHRFVNVLGFFVCVCGALVCVTLLLLLGFLILISHSCFDIYFLYSKPTPHFLFL